METLVPDIFFAFLFIGLGLVLIFLEVFIPTGGVLGLVAVAVLGLGIWGLFHHGNPVLGLTSIAVSIGFTGAMAIVLLRRIRFNVVQDVKTFTSVDQEIALLDGKEGVSESPLRPAGVARIDGRRVDVVALGGFIDKNKPVRVVDTSGNRVVVREIAAAREKEKE
jgi:membrane-bound serine protease (ClpP class)